MGEFCIKPGWKAEDRDGELLFRSSSRQGFFDYGVNAVRLNRIADDLAKKSGWAVSKINQKTHPRYWGYNCPAGKGSKAPFSTYDRFPDVCELPKVDPAGA